MGWDPPGEEPFEGRGFERLGAHFLLSYHPISATTVKLKKNSPQPLPPMEAKVREAIGFTMNPVER